jgi:folate-binding protein YgfZ
LFYKKLKANILMAIKDSTSKMISWWRPACWMQVSGEDATSFLQGQFTNDLRDLGRLPSVYGLWLNVKGRVLADGFILRGAGDGTLLIGSYFSLAETVQARLEGYIIADDVKLEDVTGEWSAVSLIGNDGGEPPPEAQCFRGRRVAGGNMEWAFPATMAEEARRRLTGSAEISAVELERRRIGAGIPAVPVDLGPGDLPNEGGLEAEAISYSKGCYLGQEVMARLKAMGRVRRRLERVSVAGAGLPAFPAPLFARSRAVGEVRSAVGDGAGGWMGLAMISLLYAGPGVRLALVPDGPPVVRREEGA